MFRKTSKTSISGRQVRTEISVSARVKIAIIGVLTLSFATLSAAPSFALGPPGGGPTITTISPAFGSPAGGTAITITGTGFNLLTPPTIVSFDSISTHIFCAGVTIVSDTSITCTTPAGTAGVYDVTVTGGLSATKSPGFAFVAPITASGVTPTSGSTAGGTAITITGTGFVAGATVSVGGAACTGVTVVSASSITCTTPAGTVGAKNVVVTNADTGAATVTGAFTYTTSADVVPVVVTVAPMTPEIAPVIKFTSTQVTCSLGKYSQTPASVVYTLVVGEDAVSTHFSNTMIPTWLVPWAGKTIDFGNATSISATWDLQAAWKGKTVSCLTLAYANNATGSTSSSAVVPS